MMKPPTPASVRNSTPLQVVIVTVCLESQLEKQVAETVEEMPWLVDISHLDSYSSAARRPAFGPQLNAAGRGIALIDFTQNVDQALDCTRFLLQSFGTRIAIVAVGDDQRSDVILEAVRAGCIEYLPGTGMRYFLKEAFMRLTAAWSASASGPMQEGSVLAFLGAKGGVGTTTLAVHLAVCLCARHNKRVLLVDAQPELGHACIYLGLDGTRSTFAEVVRNVNRLDGDLLRGYIATSDTGLAVLSSPDTANAQHPLNAAAVAKTMHFLRSEYDYVVVDCGRASTDASQTILEASSRTYLVATPEICALRDVSRHVERLSRDETSAERLHVVVNRFTSQSGLTPEEIERTLRLSVQIRVPNDYQAMVQAGNLGKPVVPHGKGEVTQAILRWSDSLVHLKPRQEAQAGQPQSGSLLSRLGSARLGSALSSARLARRGAGA